MIIQTPIWLVALVVVAGVVYLGWVRPYLKKKEEKKNRYRGTNNEHEWSLFERALLVYINKYRKSKGIEELEAEKAIYNKANVRAIEISVNSEAFSHEGRQEELSSLILDFDYNHLAEALRFGPPDAYKAFQALVGSHDHREKVLKKRGVNKIGIGTKSRNNKMFLCILVGELIQ